MAIRLGYPIESRHVYLRFASRFERDLGMPNGFRFQPYIPSQMLC